MLLVDMVKTIYHNGKRRPWVTDELDKLIEERDQRYRRYRLTWTEHDLKVFRSAIEEALIRDLHESDKIWKELRNLGLCTSGLDTPSILTTEELNSQKVSCTSIEYDGNTLFFK